MGFNQETQHLPPSGLKLLHAKVSIVNLKSKARVGLPLITDLLTVGSLCGFATNNRFINGRISLYHVFAKINSQIFKKT